MQLVRLEVLRGIGCIIQINGINILKLFLGWRLYMDGAYRQAITLLVKVTPMARRDSPN